MEEEICGTIECSGGWACGQHLQPQILGVMMASELKDHFGWSLESRKIRREGNFLPTLFSVLQTGRVVLSKKKMKCKLRGGGEHTHSAFAFEFFPVFRIM